MEKSLKLVGSTIGLITIHLYLHYFYSYIFLTKFLEKHNLETMSIITSEDIVFSFWEISFLFFFISLFSIIFIFLYREIKYSLKNKHNLLFEILFATIFIILLVLYFIFYIPENLWIFLIIFLTFLLGTTIGYVTLINKMEYIPILYFFVASFLGFMFIDFYFENYYINSNETSKEKVTKILSFDYDTKHFQTTQDTVLIFNGYKYLILKNNCENIYHLIPKEEINNLQIRTKSN